MDFLSIPKVSSWLSLGTSLPFHGPYLSKASPLFPISPGPTSPTSAQAFTGLAPHSSWPSPCHACLPFSYPSSDAVVGIFCPSYWHQTLTRATTPIHTSASSPNYACCQSYHREAPSFPHLPWPQPSALVPQARWNTPTLWNEPRGRSWRIQIPQGSIHRFQQGLGLALKERVSRGRNRLEMG